MCGDLALPPGWSLCSGTEVLAALGTDLSGVSRLAKLKVNFLSLKSIGCQGAEPERASRLVRGVWRKIPLMLWDLGQRAPTIRPGSPPETDGSRDGPSWETPHLFESPSELNEVLSAHSYKYRYVHYHPYFDRYPVE